MADLRVLVIEDSEDDYLLIVRELKRANGFDVISEQARTEKEIRMNLVQHTWDLIVCDYFLSGFDAPRVMVLLENMGIDVPFILVSGFISEEVADVALKMGAHEYVEKGELSRLGRVIHRELKLYAAYDDTLRSWGRILELRDFETAGHTERVARLSVKLAERVGVSAPELVHIKRGAYLHDIGKLAIRDDILLKKGKLTDEERIVMQGHPVIGYELVKSQPFLKRSLEICLLHHERWNGEGYPYGLKETSIPLAARLFAIVDVYDALSSHRPYRDALAENVALEYIRERAGTEFDPEIVKAFMELMKNGKPE